MLEKNPKVKDTLLSMSNGKLKTQEFLEELKSPIDSMKKHFKKFDSMYKREH